MKLIPLDAVLAEIEKRIKVLQKNPYENHKTICHLDSLEQSINSIEVTEVNLNKEIDHVWDNLPDTFLTSQHWSEFQKAAKHFFTLGVNASNPLTWEDIKTIQNISGEVYAEVAKGKDDFYLIYPTEQSFLEEVLKRFKAQKGE